MGYLLLHERYQVEYVDNRLFYTINILCVICLYLSISLLLWLSRRFRLIGAGVAGVFVFLQFILLVDSDKEIKNIISVSPNFNQIFSVKVNVDSGEAFYYRSYYSLLSRPKEKLPYEIVGEYKVEWLTNDVAAFTYKAPENNKRELFEWDNI